MSTLFDCHSLALIRQQYAMDRLPSHHEPPFQAARLMALESICSSLTLMICETSATDAHCGRFPSMMVYAALQMRMARGS
jgi:hypothetical protein